MKKWKITLLAVSLVILLITVGCVSPYSNANPPPKNDGNWASIPQPVQISEDGLKYKIIMIDGHKFLAIPTWGGNWVVAGPFN